MGETPDKPEPDETLTELAQGAPETIANLRSTSIDDPMTEPEEADERANENAQNIEAAFAAGWKAVEDPVLLSNLGKIHAHARCHGKGNKENYRLSLLEDDEASIYDLMGEGISAERIPCERIVFLEQNSGCWDAIAEPRL